VCITNPAASVDTSTFGSGNLAPQTGSPECVASHLFTPLHSTFSSPSLPLSRRPPPPYPSYLAAPHSPLPPPSFTLLASLPVIYAHPLVFQMDKQKALQVIKTGHSRRMESQEFGGVRRTWTRHFIKRLASRNRRPPIKVQS